MMLKITLLVILACLTNVAISNEQKGAVCLGENLAKSSSEHSERLYLKVGDSQSIYFVRPYTVPVIVAKNLDLNKDHIVYVYFDDAVVASWKLNFLNLKTQSVRIWRAPGTWRMEAIEISLCK